jgi:hypothetical protein
LRRPAFGQNDTLTHTHAEPEGFERHSSTSFGRPAGWPHKSQSAKVIAAGGWNRFIFSSHLIDRPNGLLVKSGPQEAAIWLGDPIGGSCRLTNNFHGSGPDRTSN